MALTPYCGTTEISLLVYEFTMRNITFSPTGNVGWPGLIENKTVLLLVCIYCVPGTDVITLHILTHLLLLTL